MQQTRGQSLGISLAVRGVQDLGQAEEFPGTPEKEYGLLSRGRNAENLYQPAFQIKTGATRITFKKDNLVTRQFPTAGHFQKGLPLPGQVFEKIPCPQMPM
jgi:hypothetical protein